jgi:hypothetical protein
MMEKATLAAALALALCAVGTPALALDNRPMSNPRCECMCDAPSFAEPIMIQNNAGLSCSAFSNRACNMENPDTGLIVTGRTIACTPDQNWVVITDDRLNNTFTATGNPQVPQQQVAPQGTFGQ